MTKYKLLAIDLDGTLLSKIKHISWENLKAIKEYVNDGGTPVIATGRSIVSANKFAKQIAKFTKTKTEYIIAFNGAYISSLNSKTIIKKMIPDAIVREIYDYIIQKKLVLWAYTDYSTSKKAVYATDTFTNLFVMFAKNVRLLKLSRNIKNLDAYKLNILSWKKWKIKSALEDLRKKYGNKLNFSLSSPRLIEINIGGVNKGSAIKYVANKMHIAPNQIAVIGDSNNDLPAFQSSHLSIAVKTKSEDLIKHSSYHINYKKHAVAFAIRNYILSNNDIELIVSDLDGTLLKNGSKEITAMTKKNIEIAVNKFNKNFAISSGRGIDDVLLTLRYFNIKDQTKLFAIICNGAAIYDVANKKYIYARCMKPETVKTIVNIIQAYDNSKIREKAISSEAYIQFSIADINSHKPLPHYRYNGQSMINMMLAKDKGMCTNFWSKQKKINMLHHLPINQILKFIIYCESPSDRARLVAILQKHKYEIVISSSGKQNIEILSPYNDKGTALKRLCDYLNINPNNAMPIGDEHNDIPMLKLSSHSVTLNSSPIDVKKEAQHILNENSSDVVGKAIELYILKK